MAISRRVLANTVATRLATLTGVTNYRAEVDETPPTISDEDLRVRPYTVLYPSAGSPGLEEDLEGRDVDLVWTFQISCVAGNSTDADNLIDRVTALFEHWFITVDTGLTGGRCKQLNDPGPNRCDKAETPPRFWSPLVYGVQIGF